MRAQGVLRLDDHTRLILIRNSCSDHKIVSNESELAYERVLQSQSWPAPLNQFYTQYVNIHSNRRQQDWFPGFFGAQTSTSGSSHCGTLELFAGTLFFSLDSEREIEY